MNEKQLNKVLIFLFVGIAFVISAPYVFTRGGRFFSFKDTGQIGDTIGGITSPITSLIGSILLFYALKAQIEANSLIKKQLDDQKEDDVLRKKIAYIANQIELVRSEINDFSYKEYLSNQYQRELPIVHHGADAVSKFLDWLINSDKVEIQKVTSIQFPKISELWMLLNIINRLIDSVRKEVIPKDDKQYFLSSLSYQFHSKIRPSFTAKIMHKGEGIPRKIFELVEEIETKILPGTF